jgi:hypothetical protein
MFQLLDVNDLESRSPWSALYQPNARPLDSEKAANATFGR